MIAVLYVYMQQLGVEKIKDDNRMEVYREPVIKDDGFEIYDDKLEVYGDDEIEIYD